MLYVRGTDPPLDGVVQKVHVEDDGPPYYTVLIAVTGREKNTDHAHLRRKGQAVRLRPLSVVFLFMSFFGTPFCRCGLSDMLYRVSNMLYWFLCFSPP